MNNLYKPCPYCFCDINKNPIFEKHQTRVSILCPYCQSHRSEWVDSVETAIESWNTYMRDDNPDIFHIKMPMADNNRASGQGAETIAQT